MLPRTLQEKLVPTQSVLLVIDMQNDFCAPGGYIDKTMGKDVSAAAPLVPVIVRFVVPAGVDMTVVIVRVDVPVPLIDPLLLHAAVAPDGRPETASDTVP